MRTELTDFQSVSSTALTTLLCLIVQREEVTYHYTGSPQLGAGIRSSALFFLMISLEQGKQN